MKNMETMKIWQTTSDSQARTEELAEELAGNLKGGEVIELVSDLGGGKTTFVRGLARGLASINTVNSPTFKIYNVYRSPTLTINHFDLYRLSEPGLVKHELAEAIDDALAVTVIEWAGAANDVLPEERLTVELEHASESQRKLKFAYPDSLTYLLKGIAT
ncbi:MAG TPA: tRNA (adenosine(37)-N6)-threonylcarbamoyltransferase complex ATPase subunit type 1 TsaE [Candidatus Binatia bacterium]|nr:tRNA (adenosine(37)-N6)-threonylcarbamoyltransferase complex ATPase subunit type 1 TsaE [Candidatus Binatia bacterium]